MPASRLYWLTEPLFAIAMAALAAMALLTVADIALRYGFHRPIGGSYELVGFLAGASLSFVLPYLQATNGHIIVDLLVRLASPSIAKFLRILALVIAFSFFTLLSWRLIFNMQAIFVSGQVSDVLGIPIWSVYAVVMVGPAVTALVCLDQLVQFFARASHS